MLHISVCDDSEHDIKLISDELEKYALKKHIQFAISTYSKPEALIYELEDNKIADIFILDVSMPGKDGFELADEIRKHSSTAVIPQSTDTIRRVPLWTRKSMDALDIPYPSVSLSGI